MSSSEAQKSPVHHATEDSTAEPTNETTRPGAAGGNADAAAGAPRDAGRNATDRRPIADNNPDFDVANTRAVIGGGPGAGDGSSGGGAGAGVPGGGTDMRTDGAFSGGNVEEDRKKLFPEATTHAGDAGPESASRDRGETSPSNDPDESSYGGPLNLDDRDAT